MRKLKLFFACLLMAVLSIGQVWGADPVTIASSTFAGNTSSCATGWSCTGTGTSSGKYWCIGKNETITTPSITFSNYESISITVQARRVGTLTGSKATIVAKVGSTTLGSNDATSTNEKTSYNIANNYDVSGLSTGSIVFTCSNATSTGSSHGAGIYSITITGVEKSTTPTCENTVSVAKVTPENGDFDISATEVCGDGDGGEVTISNIEPAPGYTLDAVSATVGSYSALTGKVTGITGNTEITVTFKVLPKYKVSFNVGGSTASQADITEASAGAGITLPDGPTPTCSGDGWTFAGWKETSAVDVETTTAPTLLLAGANYKPAADVTLYAVYKRTEEGGGESGSVEITLNTSNFPTSYGTANTFTEYTLEGYKFKIQQIYVTGSGDNKKHQWRASGNSNGTGTIYNTQVYPAKISSIVLTYHSSDANKNHTLIVGSTENPTDGTSITGTTVGSVETFDCSTANADYFVLANGANAGYTTSIKINYGSAGTTYYLSAPTCTPPAVADPVISLASGEYEGTQSGVTITCATAGAEIYYTTDDSDPTSSSIHYTGAISINASQTIKAIAIKDEAESNIVSAEYTIVTTCETPTFSLAEGSYEGTQTVEISSTRDGVTIYYTTDGSDPTNTSSVYSSALSVSSTQTIKAIATKSTLENSAIASATYTITAGPDVTLDFLDGNWGFPTSYQTTEEEFTNSVTSYAVTCKGTGSNGYKITSDYLMLGKQYAYIILPEFSNPVEKIVFVKGNGDNPSGNVVFNIFDGDDAVSTAVTGCNANKEFIIVNPAANKQYTLKVTSDHNLQIGGLKIYFGEAPAVAQPSIVGNAAFVGSQDVTISCGTEGAAIYYTTDPDKKDNPDVDTWSAYSTKVTINSTCTLYAAAIKGSDWSAVASKSFTATPLYTSIAALQGVATTSETTVFVQMTNWIVTASNGNNAYVTDGTGYGMILYKYGQDFVQGDKLNKAQLETTLQNYNGTYELKNLTRADFAGEGELVTAQATPALEITATDFAALTNANQGVLYTVNNLTYDATNSKFVDANANEIAYYNKFGIEEGLVDGHTYNVTGVAVYYKNNDTEVVQLCPRTAADLADKTAYVQISFDANTTADVTGTLPTTVTNHISGTDYTVPAASLARTDGYYQLGWNTDPDATTALTSLENVTTNQTLYAIWKETANCTISFYSKGALYATKVKAQNAEYDFNDVVAPSVQGWTFYGWSADEIATEEASATKLTSVTPTSETMTLYAIFSRKVDGTPYTQYEKVTSAPSDWSGDYLIVYEGDNTHDAVALNGALDPLEANNNGVAVTISEGVIESSSAIANAVFTIASMEGGYSIKSTNDKYIGSTSYDNKLVVSDSEIANAISIEDASAKIQGNLSGSKTILRYNYASDNLRFRYYKSGQQAIQLYKAKEVTPQVDVYTTDPVVRYNITFVLASDEEGTFNPISVKAGESATLPTSVPTKSHNAFLKWSDGENEYAAGATITNVQADIELHATWDPETPATVTFNLNGGSGNIDAITDLYGGDPYQLPAAPAYDDDHAFAGWSDGVNVYAAEAAMTMTSPAADVEYVAQWNEVVTDQVVIVAKYQGEWYAVKAAAGAANHTIVAVPVDYRYGNIYDDFTADEKAAITWTRKTVGNQMSFKNGENYLTGKTSDSNDLDLATDECFWTCDASTDPAKYYTNSIHTILYSGSAEVFKNYKSSNASADGETGAYSALPVVTTAKFNTFYTRTVSGNYGTICLPKAGVLTNGALYEISYYDADQKKIFFDEVEGGVMVAGAPYIFKPNEDVTELKVAYTDVVNAENAGHKNGLYGHYDLDNSAEDAVAARLYLTYGDYFLHNNAYWMVNEENRVYVGNYRAYIKLDKIGNDVQPQAYGRRRVSMNVNGEQIATAFDNINASEKPMKLMIDGQIFILRGEKMYDATGRLVK